MRATGALWRDTGRHVLVLPQQNRADVVALGGGGAALWRILSEPLDAHQIAERLADLAPDEPDSQAVSTCLDDLVSRKVLAVLMEKDPL